MTTALPNFVVIGAPKSGTTSLFHYLRQHPQVFLPVRKELHYFSYEQIAANVAGPRDAEIMPSLCPTPAVYAEHYAGAAAAAIGDISPSYLYYDEVRTRIRDELDDPRVVAILRDPRDKAFSQYMHLVRDGRETLGFWDALQAEPQRRARHWSDLWRYVDSSLYADHIERYLETFGPDRLRVYLFESFVADPAGTLRDLFEFLEVENGFRCDTSQVYNRTGRSRLPWLADMLARRNPLKSAVKACIPERARVVLRERMMRWNTGEKPQIDPRSSEWLTERFRDDVVRLSGLLGRDVPWLDDSKRSG